MQVYKNGHENEYWAYFCCGGFFDLSCPYRSILGKSRAARQGPRKSSPISTPISAPVPKIISPVKGPNISTKNLSTESSGVQQVNGSVSVKLKNLSNSSFPNQDIFLSINLPKSFLPVNLTLTVKIVNST